MLIPIIGLSFLIVVKNILPVLNDKSCAMQSANFPPKTQTSILIYVLTDQHKTLVFIISFQLN